MIARGFDYDRAFCRNLGLVSEAEQSRLRHARVAIAGLGGVGGAHVQAMARLGIGALHLADLDTFDVANINRQLGASMETMGDEKVTVLERCARAINPQIEVRPFASGIGPANIAEFLDGVDVVIDGLEFFRIDVRRLLFRTCRERGIPVVTAGPIGYGAAVLVFTVDGVSFDEHFRIDDRMTRAEQLLAFGLGLAPGLISDVDPARVDIAGEKGPALISACLVCAGAAATETLKLITGRGRCAAAPSGVYYDVWRGRVHRLRPRPSLRSLRGRILRHLIFARFPAFRRMHDDELSARPLKMINAT